MDGLWYCSNWFVLISCLCLVVLVACVDFWVFTVGFAYRLLFGLLLLLKLLLVCMVSWFDRFSCLCSTLLC